MPSNPLLEVHRAMGAFLVERGGTPAAARYRDAAQEILAVRRSVGVFDLTSAGKIVVRGGERMRLLQGILAADLRPLGPGGGCYSLLLSRDGRVASELRVTVLADAVLLLTPPIVRAKVLKALERHAVTSDVQIDDVTESLVLLSVQGRLSEDVVAAALGRPVPALTPWGCAELSESGRSTVLVRSPRTGEPGIDVIVPKQHAVTLFEALVAAATKVGGCACGLEALDALRVEWGRPSFGFEFDETTAAGDLPEAAATGISMTKGCFLGREAAAAGIAAGGPKMRLVGIVCGSRVRPVRGDRLLALGREVGRVTSGVHSPEIGRGIALTTVEPDAAAPGTILSSADGDSAEVTSLPFVRASRDAAVPPPS